MKAAVVRGPRQTPVYADFAEPTPAEGERRIEVAAAALSPLAKGRASGAHYSAEGAYPFVVGVDGVGRLDDGRRVYFLLPRAPNGAFAERTAAPLARCLPLPDGLDDVTAAAIANPGRSSTAALSERARLEPGETVLVNGATGAAGKLAVQISRLLGAKKVIATGRNVAASNALGADVAIPLVDDLAALQSRFEQEIAAGVDVVVDYLWGQSAERLCAAAAKILPAGKRLRFVQIGAASGANITLPSAWLRAAAVELMGSGLGSVAADRFLAAIDFVFRAAAAGKLALPTRALPLCEVEQGWDAPSDARIVFTP